MRIWLDAHLPPALAAWMSKRFEVEAKPVRDLALRDSRDEAIFLAAREARAIVLTKDSDFVHLLERHGPPPSVVWITLGNTSNARLRSLLESAWPRARKLLEQGESLVELRGKED